MLTRIPCASTGGASSVAAGSKRPIVKHLLEDAREPLGPAAKEISRNPVFLAPASVASAEARADRVLYRIPESTALLRACHPGFAYIISRNENHVKPKYCGGDMRQGDK